MIWSEMLAWVTVLCYSFLYIAVLFLWIPYKKRIPVWSIAFIIACFFALMSNQIESYAVFTIIIIGYALHYREKKYAHPAGRMIAGIIVLFWAYGLGAHVIPYFHNLKVLSNVYISQDGTPFTLYLNFDKTIVGLFILGLTQRLLSNKEEWIAMFKQTIPKTVLFIFILVFLALIAGEVHFDPKLPECLPIWLITNLLFVCVAEEGFFRGFIQKNLAELFRNFAWGNLIALIIASLLFGFAHYAGGIAYSIWGTIAGLGYGWIYQKTNRIESSILAHFSLNIVHFLLFTYPAIA
ncbi:CPBP family intramembrane glutamic endopeptidase [Pelosinus sp. sgz500959]|uniref:CPBP family intramembrane glutamic endopeptidase n=1 Tax=Pelosinus sp. sgz500959 TaxID=3242472 RepID=UPI00366EB750